MTKWGPLHCLYVFVCARSVNSIMSNSLWYYRLQPSRLLCPWEMPLKNDQNYKMGASPLPVCVCVCVCVCARVRARTCSVNSIVSNSLWHCRMPARLLCPRDSPGKNTGVGCHALLQGIWGDLPDPGVEPRSPVLQVDSLPPGKHWDYRSSSLMCSIFSSRGKCLSQKH